MAKKKKAKSKQAVVPFEDALEKLKQVVSQLENGNLTLSESLEQYEQGVANLKNCYAALELAQKKIELLVRIDGDGNAITQPFDDRATAHPTRSSTRETDYDDSDAQGDGDDDPWEAADEEDEDMDDPGSLF